MAWESPLYVIPGLVAGADLTESQFRFMQLGANLAVTRAGIGDRTIGVLQNAPADTLGAEVMTAGVTKLLAGVGDLAVGDEVIPGANGTAIAAGAGDPAYGIVLEAAVAGDVATVLINCMATEAV